MKKGWVITIGREFCSGGSEVARKVAQRLSIPYYDRDLIDSAVERTNLSREAVEAHDERTGAFRLGDPYGMGYRYRDDPSLVLIHRRGDFFDLSILFIVRLTHNTALACREWKLDRLTSRNRTDRR